MKTKKYHKLLLMLLVSLVIPFVAPNASAQLYLGLNFGQSVPVNLESESSFPETEGDLGYRFFVGNSISEHLGFEISYFDLGTYEVGTVNGEDDPLVAEDTINITGADFSVVAKWNWTKYLNVFGSMGVFLWEGERYVRETEDVGGTPTERESTLSFDGYNMSVGMGLDYRIWRSTGLKVEARQYITDDVANQLIGLGVYYSF